MRRSKERSRRIRFIAGLISAAVLSVLAPASASAVELGSDLQGPNEGTHTCLSAPCVLIQDTIANDPFINVVPDDGHITKFTVKGASGSVALVVFRDTGGGLQEVGGTNPVTINSTGEVAVTISPSVPVEQNDLLALRLVNGTSQIGSSDAGSGAGTTLVELANTSPFGEVRSTNEEMYFRATFAANPPPPPPPPPPVDNSSDTIITEPAGPDVFAELRAGKRPRAKIFGGTSRMSRKGVVKVKIANPNDYTLTGKMTLKRGRSRLGATRFGIGPNSRRYVRIKLSRRARRKLVRKRRMKVVAVMFARARIGKSRTVRRRITLKAPPRPRRRRGGSGGGGGGGSNGNVCGTPRFGPGYTDINGIFHPGQLNYCPNLFPDLTF